MAVITPFKVKCESCELTLTVNDPGLIGKKIYCKRCKYPIQIKSPDDAGAMQRRPRRRTIKVPARPKSRKQTLPSHRKMVQQRRRKRMKRRRQG